MIAAHLTSLAAVAALIGGMTPAAPAGPPDTLFAITYQAGPNWKPGLPMSEQGLREHFYYWKTLDENGRVGVAGALGPDGGLVLLRASSPSEASAVIAEDPAVKAGLFVGEARPFVPFFVGKAPMTPATPR